MDGEIQPKPTGSKVSLITNGSGPTIEHVLIYHDSTPEKDTNHQVKHSKIHSETD